MGFVLQPWQFLLVILAGWVNQQQQQIIEFQRTEIEVLKEKLGKKRIMLNADQRRRLAPGNWTTTLDLIPGRIGPDFGRNTWKRTGDGSRRP